MEPWFRLDPFQGVVVGGGTCIDAIILSAARIFRRLRDFPLLADLDLFSARTAKLPFVLIHLLSMQRALALVHLFPRNFVGLSAVSPAALFVYRRICRGIKKAFTMHTGRAGNRCCDLAEERGKVEVRSLETLRNSLKSF